MSSSGLRGSRLAERTSIIRVVMSEIIAITGNDELFDEHYSTRDEASVLSFMCGDERYPGSILCSLRAARENLRTTRDVIPREIWEEINQLFLSVKEQVEAGISPRRRDAFLSRVIRSCQTVNGLIVWRMQDSTSSSAC